MRAKKLALSSVIGLGRRTVSGMLCAGAQQFTDWSAVYRLFDKERFDRQALFSPVRGAVVDQLPKTNSMPRRGRRKWYGSPLPTPEYIRQDESIPWTEVHAFAAGMRHAFEVKTIPAVRWAGTGDRTVRIVIVRPLAYRPRKGARLLYRNPAYLLCTDPRLPLDVMFQ